MFPRTKIRYEFAARGDLAPVTAWNYDSGNRPPKEATADVEAAYGNLPNVGAMLLGERGTMYVGGWGAGNLIKLKGDEKMRGVNDHPAAKGIPQTEPRAPKQNHMLEWIEAAQAGKKAYQCFEVAAHSMEVILPAVVSLRMQRPIDWDGVNMKVPGAPEADTLHPGRPPQEMARRNAVCRGFSREDAKRKGDGRRKGLCVLCGSLVP